MAVKSIQLPPDSSNLKALLAYQAYQFNQKYSGNQHDADIYSGLYQSVRSILGKTNVFKGHTSSVRSVAFMPGSGIFFSSGGDGRILKWDINDEKRNYEILSEDRGPVEQITVSNDGKYLAGYDNRGGVLLFDLSSGSEAPRILKGGESGISSIVIGPDSKSLYLTGLKNTIEYWDLESLSFMVLTTVDSKINSLAVSPDGVNLAGGTMDGRMIVWRIKGEVKPQTVYNNNKQIIYSVTYSPDGKYLACGDSNGDIRLFRGDSFELLSLLPGNRIRITQIRFSPDCRTFAASSYDQKVRFWEIADLTNPPVIMDDNQGYIFAIAFSPDGKYLVSASAEGDNLISRPTSTTLLSGRICSLIDRNFTTDEWKTYVGSDIPYEKTCLTVKKLNIGVKQDDEK